MGNNFRVIKSRIVIWNLCPMSYWWLKLFKIHNGKKIIYNASLVMELFYAKRMPSI
jgi:hypothetical protein